VGGRVRGLVYRLRAGHPDRDVPDQVLAQRIRSTLGPLQKRLGTGRMHVVVCDHVASLHGVVDTVETARALEQATLRVWGVDQVVSYLRLGAAPVRQAQPRRSEAYQRLRSTVAGAGITGIPEGNRIIREVLATFLRRLPEQERRHVSSHLPEDVRALIGEVTGPPSDIRARSDFYAAVATSAGTTEENVPALVGALLGDLRALVPEEVDDVGAVLPADLEDLWRDASVTPVDEGGRRSSPRQRSDRR
jgi:uncharacterized protein (DUF2267 family)